jgi:hypothetical protein
MYQMHYPVLQYTKVKVWVWIKRQVFRVTIPKDSIYYSMTVPFSMSVDQKDMCHQYSRGLFDS